MNDKIVLVTGATSGFGKATASSMVQEGADVVIASRNESNLKSTKQEIGCAGYIKMDVTKPADWKRAYNYIKENFGKLDVLVNCAGGGISIKEMSEQTTEDIDKIIKLNLNSVIYGSKVFGEMMKEQESGTIINFSSVCSREAWPEWTVYGAAKAGVLNFSKGLYVELQPYNVRVVCINPGASSTGFQKNSGINEVSAKLRPEDIGQVVTDICKLPSHVVVEEVTVWGIDQVVIPL